MGRASALVDQKIEGLADWRGRMLARVRSLIHRADPEIVEEWKWRGVPVWSHAGIVCTGETYKSVVKLTFVKGGSLPDPAGLFNSSLEGKVRRAIDLHEGDELDENAFVSLIQAAVTWNEASKSKRVGLPRVRSAMAPNELRQDKVNAVVAGGRAGAVDAGTKG